MKGYERSVSFDLREVSLRDVAHMFETHHVYKSCGGVSTHTFAVFEGGRPVAAWTWNPPPPGCARALAPEAPWSVLSLSRMVAVDRVDRNLRHISKPLRHQMRRLLDRGRWPVLVTFSDASVGHTGHVYRCSGWAVDGVVRNRAYVDDEGRRKSIYSGGGRSETPLTSLGYVELTRWVHRACPSGSEEQHARASGWVREAIPGKTWRSGKPAYRVVRAGGDRA
jgi:hypothetical protein